MTPVADHREGAVHEFRGVRTADHFFTVPLRPAELEGETLEVFAREYGPSGLKDEQRDGLPWLLFFQGGPGFPGNRWTALSGWAKAATEHFRVLMLDQRGTGLSSPVEASTLAARGDAAAQAEYLTHFRHDSIVADAEAIRGALGVERWSIFGQSFGGWCSLAYLSLAPAALREVLITGGLAPLQGSPDRVYRATYSRMEARNREYFGWYPEDRALVNRIAAHLREVPEFLPRGDRLTVERFQMLGMYLGGNTRVDSLHYLLEKAFIQTPEGERLSQWFLAQLPAYLDFAPNPLYAVIHESIYAQEAATDWSSWRVLQEFPQFSPEAEDVLLTGEMIQPWLFEQDPTLRPLTDVAELLAAKQDWPRVFDLDVLATNTVPVAAAVYADDVFVDRDLSLETASSVRGLQTWVTPDFHHDGIADDGEAIFRRLLAMARGGDFPEA
ncbi:alpha/beta fold hydrolase [Arthrobacter woluwensis]|uniref:Proline iminopeptidase n=1 Tax=Arthrobacter woluwensis TaxID=156980 RepID=A0A1H4QJH6_9MICC|nr:alpha/beta fold hydrolase [Arthrobacter woluwensis]SEC19718.1 proline iminopeptidase [Arthrobacter woluwensis]